jgi:hypothetical protein
LLRSEQQARPNAIKGENETETGNKDEKESYNTSPLAALRAASTGRTL